MAQFLIGFWCGCVSATLVLCLLYANKRRKAEYGEPNKGYGGENIDPGGGIQASSSAGHVLLVDDSRLSRTVLKELLKKYAFTFWEAESGEECLKLAKTHRFDLIFLDQNMPGLSGDETLQRLRKEGEENKNVPVIAVSSSARKENEKEFQKKGYMACLGKPLQGNRLEEIVSWVFEQKETEKVQPQQKCPEGFLYRKGLENFDRNEEAFRETLVLFAELWKERREQLEQFLEEGNMPEYAILIHAIKGDARTLGADVLGELAYAQELAAKEGNTEAVRDGFDRVIKLGDETSQHFVQQYS